MQSKNPTRQYHADEFLICAGCILFRRTPVPKPPSIDGIPNGHTHTRLEVCLLRHTIRDEWLLPKGRKDRDESITATAIRETYEESGYPCILLPISLRTRAPASGAQTKDCVELVERSCEPFMMTMRQVADRNVKMIWWFVAVVEGEKVTGTQTLVESYESQFFDVQEAVEKATFQSDRDVIETAVGIVKDTFGDGTLI